MISSIKKYFNHAISPSLHVTPIRQGLGGVWRWWSRVLLLRGRTRWSDSQRHQSLRGGQRWRIFQKTQPTVLQHPSSETCVTCTKRYLHYQVRLGKKQPKSVAESNFYNEKRVSTIPIRNSGHIYQYILVIQKERTSEVIAFKVD